jgi:hypothetical protein
VCKCTNGLRKDRKILNSKNVPLVKLEIHSRPRDYVDNGLEQNYDTSDYYYVTEWRDKVVDSSSFYIRHGHHNPR